MIYFLVFKILTFWGAFGINTGFGFSCQKYNKNSNFRKKVSLNLFMPSVTWVDENWVIWVNMKFVNVLTYVLVQKTEGLVNFLLFSEYFHYSKKICMRSLILLLYCILLNCFHQIDPNSFPLKLKFVQMKRIPFTLGPERKIWIRKKTLGRVQQ